MTNRVHIICHPEAGSGDGNTILKKFIVNWTVSKWNTLLT